MPDNLLTYASALHRFTLNDHGYVQIEIFGYNPSMERFENVLEKALIPSMTMKFLRCFIAASTLIEKGLGVLLQLHTTNSSILMFLLLQSRPWSCQIVYTLAHSTFQDGSMKFLAMNSIMTIFIHEDQISNGIFIIENSPEKSQRNIQTIPCSLLTYIYCYLKGNSYWIMGTEIDTNNQRKFIQVYYGLFTSSPIPFTTDQFVPLSLIDNIQTLHIVHHQLQLKPRRILGDVIISTFDHRILTCHHGMISHQLNLNSSIISIQSYLTIENEQLYLFGKEDRSSMEIFQCDDRGHLVPYGNSHQTAECVLMDDFTQIGWKQILFLRDRTNFNAFILTDFSQIHVFQQEFDDHYHAEEKHWSMEIDDADTQQSLLLVQNILRKKIINAEFIINEGYFQCKQIENNIRKIASKYPIKNLQNSSDNLSQNSNPSSKIVQLKDTNWFIAQSNIYLYATIENISNLVLTSVHLFAVNKHSNKFQLFSLTIASQSSFNEKNNFNLNPHSSITLVLTTIIDLEKDLDIDLYLLIDPSNELFHIDSIIIPIDDLINPNHRHILQIHALQNESKEHFMYQQGLIYFQTFFRLAVRIQSTSKLTLIEHCIQFLSTIGFRSMIDQLNVYIRINEGNIFDNVLIHFMDEDHLIIRFYAKDCYQTTMLAKYILSKLDFQTFSIVDSADDLSNEENPHLLQRLELEFNSYLNTLKELPTIMRKVAPISKSEAYRLLKSEDFQRFELESHQTDFLFTSSMID